MGGEAELPKLASHAGLTTVLRRVPAAHLPLSLAYGLRPARPGPVIPVDALPMICADREDIQLPKAFHALPCVVQVMYLPLDWTNGPKMQG